VSTLSIGGHNLGSNVTRIQLDPSVGRGALVEVEGGGGAKILRVHPDDAAKAGPIARLHARSEVDADAGRKIRETLATARPPREVNAALDLGPEDVARGLSPAEERGLFFDGVGFRTRAEPFSAARLEDMRSVATRLGYDLVIERSDAGFVVFHMRPPGYIETLSTPALVEVMMARTAAAASHNPPRILFRNFAAGEPQALVKTATVREVTSNGGAPPRMPPRLRGTAAAPDGSGPHFHVAMGREGEPPVVL
jgi:hypothetical protein